ncbi:MAG: hypothetical protein IT210_18335 [Armatimonadetes bacterium]|nr:hypothetical protein [Armatimonadota bacterium]
MTIHCRFWGCLLLLAGALGAAEGLPSHWLGFAGGCEGITAGPGRVEAEGLSIRLRPESRYEGEGVLLRETRSPAMTGWISLFGTRRLEVACSALLPVVSIATESPILSLNFEGDWALRSVATARKGGEPVAIRSRRYTLYQSAARGPLPEPWVRLRFRKASTGEEREWLLALGRQPVQIAAFFQGDRPASLEIRSKRTGKVFLMEISPGASQAAARRLVRITRALPSAFRETVEAGEGGFGIASTFTHALFQDEWKTAPLYAAPLPPLASYAKSRGWDVRLPARTEALGLLTGSGPLYALLNAREARYTIPPPPSAEFVMAVPSPDSEEARRALAADRPRLIRVGLAAPWTEETLQGLDAFLDACRQQGKVAFIRPEFPPGFSPALRPEAWKALADRLRSRGVEMAGYDAGASEPLAIARAADPDRDALIGPIPAPDFDRSPPAADRHVIYTFSLPEGDSQDAAILPALRFRLRTRARVMLDATASAADEKGLKGLLDLCARRGVFFMRDSFLNTDEHGSKQDQGG